MGNALLITKIMLKNLFSSFNMSARKGRRAAIKKKSGVVIALVLIIAFLIISLSFFFTAYSYLDLSKKGNFVGELVTITAVFGFVFIFIFSITMIIATFFLATDTTIYLSLPIKPWELFFGRLVCCLITIYLMQIVFILPMIIAFDIVINPSFIVYINQILLFVAFPWIQVSVLFLILLFVSQIINVYRHRNLLTFLLIIIIIALYAIIQINGLEYMLDDTIIANPDEIARLKDLYSSLAESLSFANFYAVFFKKGFMDGTFFGFLYSLSYFGISAAVLCFSCLMANKFYLKAIIVNEDKKIKRKHKRNELVNIKSNSSFKEYLKKEWRLLYRTPNYFMQLLFPVILVFCMIIIMIFSAYTAFSSDVSWKEVAEMLSPYTNDQNAGFPLLIIGLSSFGSFTFMSSSCAISREGSNAYLLKILPLSPLQQIRAKILIGVIINTIFTISLLVMASIFLRPNQFVLWLSLIPAVLSSIIINYLMILIDLRFPFLDWSNDLAAVKQNKTVLLGFLVNIGASIIFIGLGFALLMLKFSSYIVLVLLTIIFCLIIYLIEKHLKNPQKDIFVNIEQ